ncbi:MAG: AMP phosphorylase [Candidatus Hadarchaeota archaeon]|nr:AMP phosphorylase [Candidatus Hadarchaeota archaeon]
MKLGNLKVKPLETESGHYIVALHEDDAQELGVHTGDRVKLSSLKGELVAITNTTQSLVQPGNIGTFAEVTEELRLEPGNTISITSAPKPLSLEFIRKKMRGESLGSDEIHAIAEDIVAGNLSSTEMTAFVVAQYIRDMSMQEIAALTRAMIDTGETLQIDIEPILDVHSIGGIPGNKYALVTVPIVASAGLAVPKTSSRAITSAAGTADVMEVLAKVVLSLDEIKQNLRKVGAVLAWGGAVNLAPADDIIINVERPLGIDPRSQLLASVMSKKMAVGADKILIDIPTGHGAKVESSEEARDFAYDFMSLGHELGVQVETALTYGGQPLGYAIGPVLEAKEALETLGGKGPTSITEKATSLAGIMLESAGAARIGGGKQIALDILKSGKAYQKMREIIEAQGGNPDVKAEDLPIGDKKEVVTAPRSGYVTRIYNSRVKDIALAAGAPRDKGSGIKLSQKEGRKVKEGDPLFEIYAQHEKKLSNALNLARKSPPVRIEGMLLERVTRQPRVG